MEKHDRELAICEWMVERHQLKAENKKLARQLEDANNKISSLRKKLLPTTSTSHDNSDDPSISSHDATVKAGSSRPPNSSKSKKQKVFSGLALWSKAAKMEEKIMHKEKVTKSGAESKRTRMKEGRSNKHPQAIHRSSSFPPSGMERSSNRLIWETPCPKSYSSKSSRCYPTAQLSSSFDSSTQASSRASLASLAKFAEF